MQADHVALGVMDEGDEAIPADGPLLQMDASTIADRAAGFDRAVIAGEIDDGASAAGILVGHFNERTGAAPILHVHGECPNFEVGTLELSERGVECVLIECFGALHVADIDFEPADGIGFVHECGLWVML